jgi:hypothetical protein
MYRDIDAAMIEGLNWLGSPNIPARARPGIVESAAGGGAPAVIRASRAPGEPSAWADHRGSAISPKTRPLDSFPLIVASSSASGDPEKSRNWRCRRHWGRRSHRMRANEIVDLDYAAEHRAAIEQLLTCIRTTWTGFWTAREATGDPVDPKSSGVARSLASGRRAELARTTP